MPVFLLKLAYLITQLVWLSLCFIVMGLLKCARALPQVTCIVNMLRDLVARYMFTQVRCMQYLSSNNSLVAVRIGNHTRKGKALILLRSYDKFLLPLSHLNLLTTADSAIPLYTCSRINLVTENDRSDTLITMWHLS